MNELLIYFLKVNIAIALFYLFYRLFFAGDTFWKTRRYYLLLSLFVSFTYPFLSIENWLQSQEPVKVFVANYAMLQEFIVTPNQEQSFSLESILYFVYVLVSVVLLLKMIVQLISIFKIRIQGKVQLIQNTRIIAVQRELTPFSFFRSIYLNPALHNEEETRQILAHESTHVRQGHSYDVILSELLTIAFWINPSSWLMKREIRQNLEFLADNKVLESGFDTKSYQYHLLQLAYQTPEIKIANKFNVSPLKKRITMMNQQRTSKAGILKYLLIVPLAAALVISSNAENIISSVKSGLKENKNVQTQEKTTTKSTSKLDELVVVGYGQAQGNQKSITPPPAPPAPPIPPVQGDSIIAPPPPPVPGEKNVVFTVVEKMPAYPGGSDALMKFLANNIKYPVRAQEKGIQGRVICQFVVKADGSIGDVDIVRSVDPNLDAEAIRVVKAMPLWTPGQQKGQNVNVKYTLPINFNLKRNDTDKKPANNSTETFTVVDKMPQFPGGESGLLKYIGDNLKYPVTAQKNGIQGRIIVRFIVNKLGRVENAEVLRSLDPECDNEALRVVNAMPEWIPGEQKGEKVSVYYTLPITYKLTK
ncbi:MAG: M56 family metallopeptidase [Paludibacter sp.]|jgi:TonB family protein